MKLVNNIQLNGEIFNCQLTFNDNDSILNLYMSQLDIIIKFQNAWTTRQLKFIIFTNQSYKFANKTSKKKSTTDNNKRKNFNKTPIELLCEFSGLQDVDQLDKTFIDSFLFNFLVCCDSIDCGKLYFY